MIYLDNAATTYQSPFRCFIRRKKALYDCGANPEGRVTGFRLKTSRQVFYAREKCAEFFGGETENTVFTLNCTHAINFALKGVCNAKGHCHVITSDLEHNSVIRPLHALYKQKRINYSIADGGGSDDELLPRLVRKQ
ncbi:MAG: aminotransferase class V-fold PLP-dependent enzyme [[Eubacterium] siraeum]